MNAEKPPKEQLDQWHDDPSNWILGIFYYNKADKRIFPPKRLRYLGWTTNFANPWSIVAIVVVIALAYFITSLMK